ncbi:DUF1217 domain-containing protein [Gemmobacter nectariphilus]|jgi:hypothetical protein|uniref:DUF1217 domain-containing protein n=1 Tax=Gemmobacter nectariphilus TaxID=220343 RepID=UPI00040F9338|nr:DUF1217 domain-containing protein [Gemmobacter nectariphilus]
MSYVPSIGLGGYAGWAVLKRTEATQKAAFDNQSSVKRDEDYFREKIGQVTTPEQLVSDRRLLNVALGAFGLEDDIDNRYFIRKVLEDGTLTEGALALKLSDTRYREFATAFGFDLAVPKTRLSDFPDKIVSQWKDRQFEVSVGTVDESLRLAMNAERELSKLAGSTMSEDAKWFSVMGQGPLRAVLETAFGLPSAFGSLDIDTQKSMLKQKAKAAFGDDSVAQFAEPGRMDALVKRYLLRNQVANMGSGLSASSVALTLVSQTALAMKQ